MRKSTGPTNRSVVNHGVNGKGSKTRVTNVQAYRRNFDEINWGRHRMALRPGDRLIPIIYKRTLEELRDEYEFRHGL